MWIYKSRIFFLPRARLRAVLFMNSWFFILWLEYTAFALHVPKILREYCICAWENNTDGKTEQSCLFKQGGFLHNNTSLNSGCEL